MLSFYILYQRSQTFKTYKLWKEKIIACKYKNMLPFYIEQVRLEFYLRHILMDVVICAHFELTRVQL